MPEKIEIIDERKPPARQDPDNLSWGIALVLVGLVFLLDTLGLAEIPFYNWWAIFIFLPGINLLTRAWYYYRDYGVFTGRASRSAWWGLALVLLAITFFYDLNLTLIFPFVLICTGLYLLFSR